MPWWSLPPSREGELMDDPALPTADHQAALSALARINAVSLTVPTLARAVDTLMAECGQDDEPPRVVDLACGGGDVTVGLAAGLAARARAAGRPAPRVTGLDKSPTALDRARRLAASRGVAVTFLERDLATQPCPPCDVAVSSLFLHHLDDLQARDLLATLRSAARRGVVVSDLLRSRLGLVLAVLGTSLLSSSRVARVDGPRSVRAARTLPEYRGLLESSGLSSAHLRRTWPERVLVIWTAERSPTRRDVA